MSTWSDSYVRPARVKIKIKSPDDSTTYYTYDSFRSSNEFALSGWEVKTGVGQTGTFGLLIDDSVDKIINPDLIDCDSIVIIQLGKSQSEYQNIMYGISSQLRVAHKGPTGRQYTMYGEGTGIITQHTIVNFEKEQPLQTLQTNVHLNEIYDNPKFYACNLFKEVFTSIDILPVGGLSLQDRGNFSLAGIRDDITTMIPSINQPNIPASQVLNAIADSVGAYWGVDENNEVYFNFGFSESSGIIVKDLYEEGDDENYVSYVEGFSVPQWDYTDSTRISDGFLQRGIAVATRKQVTGGSSDASGSTALWNQDIAVQRIPGPQRFQDLSFVLSRVGPGTDIDRPTDTYLRGAILTDKGGSEANDPAEDDDLINTVAVFQIPLQDIETSPKPTPKINIQFLVQDIQIDKPHWIVLYEQGDSSQNTVLWWHDNDTTTTGRYSAIRPLPQGRGPSGKTISPIGWVVSSHGPVYTHAFSTSSNVLIEASDPGSIDRWGGKGLRPKEGRIDVAWAANDFLTADLYMGQRISAFAKKIRNYSVGRVTIPNTFFKPNRTIQIIDSQLSGLDRSKNITAELMEIRYAGSGSDQDPIGVRTCEIIPRGYISPYEYAATTTTTT